LTAPAITAVIDIQFKDLRGVLDGFEGVFFDIGSRLKKRKSEADWTTGALYHVIPT
jgi:hypothetical protein